MSGLTSRLALPYPVAADALTDYPALALSMVSLLDTRVAWRARKTTTKDVNTTVAATDLLNGEIILPAGIMGANGHCRVVAICDYLNNSGVAVVPPRIAMKLGATVMGDPGAPAGTEGAAANRWPFLLEAIIQNLGAVNAQIAWLRYIIPKYTLGAGSVGDGGGCGSSFSSNNSGGTVHKTGLAVDTTAALALTLPVVNGSAAATYSTRLLAAHIEVVSA